MASDPGRRVGKASRTADAMRHTVFDPAHLVPRAYHAGMSTPRLLAALLAFALAATTAPAQAPTVRVDFTIQSAWSTGYQVELRIANQAPYTIHDWTLDLPWSGTVTSIWNGSVRSQANGRTVFAPVQASWEDGDLQPGEVVVAGFIAATPAGAVPADGLLNGSPVTIGVDSPAPPRLRPPPARPWPSRVFAPYVDVTLWPPFDFDAYMQNQGVRFLNFAFVVAEPGTTIPSWGGYHRVSSDHLMTEFVRIRRAGGDVMVSFGGAAGTELAVACPDVATLQAAYQSVVDTYALTHIDFDIEGIWAVDPPSIARRSAAIAGLQQAARTAGRELNVWFTLPVLPTGLTQDGRNILASALQAGVDIAGVNVMAMNYGSANAPQGSTQMGAYAIQAATSLHQQLSVLHLAAGRPRTSAQLWRMVGVTPMIGLNDLTTEVFRQQDAQQLLAFAQQQELGMLSFWSATRDKSCAGGTSTTVSPACSSILQAPWEFTAIFRQYTNAALRDLGGATACAGGTPNLTVAGELRAGTTFSLQITGAQPGQLAAAVFGFARDPQQVPGGTLVPRPDLAVAILANAQGTAGLSFTWPPAFPPGVGTWHQAWLPDPLVPLGACVSNAWNTWTP